MASSVASFTAHHVDWPEASSVATPDVMGHLNAHPVVDFDADTDKIAYFRGVVPREYAGSDLTVELSFSMSSTTTGNVVWLVAFEYISGSGSPLDKDTNGFAADRTVTQAVAGTQGQNAVASLTFTQAQADGIAAGDTFRIRVTRDADNASDTATGDAELDTVDIYVA